jgi:hypothetical protein
MVMAKFAFKIDFPNRPNGFVHRLQNFAEDLHLKLARPGFGSVRDIDSITECAEVEVNAKRFLGEVAEQIHKALVRHNFADAIVHKL